MTVVCRTGLAACLTEVVVRVLCCCGEVDAWSVRGR